MMFKKNRFAAGGRGKETAQALVLPVDAADGGKNYIFVIECILFGWVLLSLTACSTTPLPPVNLQQPGWTVREGQAVWKRDRTAPEIAGEVLVASDKNGQEFVQFTKTPFPMIIAQSASNHWQVEIPMQNKRYSGPGSPPARLIWLYLPRLLSGQPPPKNWSWNALADDRWQLENHRTGESISGYLSPPAR
jgi:hypothetical protein